MKNEVFELSSDTSITPNQSLAAMGKVFQGYRLGMGQVDLCEVRQNAAALLRRVEGGEQIEITVSGRIVACMVSASPRRWPRWEEVADVFLGRPDSDWDRDQDLLDQSLLDPWEPRR